MNAQIVRRCLQKSGEEIASFVNYAKTYAAFFASFFSFSPVVIVSSGTLTVFRRCVVLCHFLGQHVQLHTHTHTRRSTLRRISIANFYLWRIKTFFPAHRFFHFYPLSIPSVVFSDIYRRTCGDDKPIGKLFDFPFAETHFNLNLSRWIFYKPCAITG